MTETWCNGLIKIDLEDWPVENIYAALLDTPVKHNLRLSSDGFLTFELPEVPLESALQSLACLKKLFGIVIKGILVGPEGSLGFEITKEGTRTWEIPESNFRDIGHNYAKESAPKSKPGRPAQLVLFRGLPGSGKSTAARQSGMVVVEADQFWDTSGYKSNLKNLAHTWCLTQTAYWLLRGQSVTVANTCVLAEHIQPYAEMAKKFGAEFAVRKCLGKFQSTHPVPENTMLRYRATWEDWPGETTYGGEK